MATVSASQRRRVILQPQEDSRAIWWCDYQNIVGQGQLSLTLSLKPGYAGFPLCPPPPPIQFHHLSLRIVHTAKRWTSHSWIKLFEVFLHFSAHWNYFSLWGWLGVAKIQLYAWLQAFGGILPKGIRETPSASNNGLTPRSVSFFFSLISLHQTFFPVGCLTVGQFSWHGQCFHSFQAKHWDYFVQFISRKSFSFTILHESCYLLNNVKQPWHFPLIMLIWEIPFWNVYQ